MKTSFPWLAACAALAVGVAQYFLLAFCRAWLAAYDPLPAMLAGALDPGVALAVLVFVVDAIIAVLLSLPAALVLTRLRPPRLGWYLLLAVLPAFLWANRGVIGSPYLSLFAWRFAAGWLLQLFALPIAAWLLVALRDRRTRGRRPSPASPAA